MQSSMRSLDLTIDDQGVFNGSITINTDVQRIWSSSPEPDPDWVFTDEAGHEHRWDHSQITAARWAVDVTYWCADCHDEHEDGHWECAECGERIEPRLRPPSPVGTLIPGMTTWTVEFYDPDRLYQPGQEVEVRIGDHRGHGVVCSFVDNRTAVRGFGPLAGRTS